MADPVTIPCPKDQWTLISDSKQGGTLHILDTSAQYLWTYRTPGGTAPTSIEEGVYIVWEDGKWNLPNSVKSDYYIYCRNNDGSVRFDDLPLTSDVFLQDQTTPWGDFFALQLIGSTTLTADTVRGDYDIEVASIASISIGDYIGIFSGTGGEEKKQFATVLNITSLTLTLDTPIDRVFPSDTGNVASFLRDMNVDGSVTPQVFEIQAGSPAGDLEIDVTRIMTKCFTTGATPLNDFGDITDGLTRGLVCRVKEPGGNYDTKWNVKNNGEIGHLCYDFNQYTATGQGQNGFLSRFSLNGQDKHGVPQRVSSNIKTIEFVVQDDLTSLESYSVLGANQEVDQ